MNQAPQTVPAPEPDSALGAMPGGPTVALYLALAAGAFVLISSMPELLKMLKGKR